VKRWGVGIFSFGWMEQENQTGLGLRWAALVWILWKQESWKAEKIEARFMLFCISLLSSSLSHYLSITEKEREKKEWNY
jgi:hypothetical protein